MLRKIALTALVGIPLLALASVASADDPKSYSSTGCRATSSGEDRKDTVYACPVINDALGSGIKYARIWHWRSRMHNDARCNLIRSAPGFKGYQVITKRADSDGVFRFDAMPWYSWNDRYEIRCQGQPGRYYVVEG